MRPILTRRYYCWLALVFVGVAIYGSLVPLHLKPMPLSEAVVRFRAALGEPVRIESRSDWAANILLFIPMGFLLMGALVVDRRPIAGWFAAGVVLPVCTVLSTAIEFTQLYFPDRVTSIDDIAAESVGGFLGVGLWLCAGQRISLWLRRFWVDLGGGQSSTGSLLLAYIVFLVLVHLMPMDLTISPAMIYHKYREGRVVLVPFAAGGQVDKFAMIQKCLTNMAFFLPVGVLAAGLEHPFWRRGRNWPAMAVLGFAFAGLIELMQLFVLTRYFDSTDIVTGGVGVLVGWRLGIVHSKHEQLYPPKGSWVVDRQGLAVRAKTKSQAMAYWALAGWLGLLVLVEWQPFDFNFSTSEAGRRLGTVSLVPFADYQQSDYLQAFDQICSKTVVFLPFGALLAWLGFGPKGRGGGLLVLAPAILLTTALEGGQLFLPTRYASVTDVLIESFGVWLGFIVVRRGQGANFQENSSSRLRYGGK
jgi:glycopeptide antibiotics resistance protein